MIKGARACHSRAFAAGAEILLPWASCNAGYLVRFCVAATGAARTQGGGMQGDVTGDRQGGFCRPELSRVATINALFYLKLGSHVKTQMAGGG